MPSLKQKTKENRKLIVWHCAGWLLYIIYDNIYLILFSKELIQARQLGGELLFSLYSLSVSVITFYSLVFFLQKFLRGKRIIAITGILFVLICTFVLSDAALDLFTYLQVRDAPAKGEFAQVLILSSVQFFIPFFMYALAYVLAVSISKKQTEIALLQVANQQMEDEKKEKELKTVQLQNAFLRSQINPHFLYNTLNFFYARSLSHSDELAEGILTLSEIMRYSLQPAEEQSRDEVPLNNEINHIRNIIKLNKLRYKDNLFILFEVNGKTDGIAVVPLTLITIVENVFKHGEINNPAYPATVRITASGESLVLYCHNKKKGGMKEPGTGIGLENTRQRLQQVYNNSFSLTTKEDDHFFTTVMTIDYRNTDKKETHDKLPGAGR